MWPIINVFQWILLVDGESPLVIHRPLGGFWFFEFFTQIGSDWITQSTHKTRQVSSIESLDISSRYYWLGCKSNENYKSLDPANCDGTKCNMKRDQMWSTKKPSTERVCRVPCDLQVGVTQPVTSNLLVVWCYQLAILTSCKLQLVTWFFQIRSSNPTSGLKVSAIHRKFEAGKCLWTYRLMCRTQCIVHSVQYTHHLLNNELKPCLDEFWFAYFGCINCCNAHSVANNCCKTSSMKLLIVTVLFLMKLNFISERRLKTNW